MAVTISNSSTAETVPEHSAGDQDLECDMSDRKMLEFLVCPLTHTVLEYDESNQELVSRAARLAFPIRDGIPIMLESEARRLDEEADGV
jgi:uncharacterized protein